MNCKKCGKPLENNEIYCADCAVGTKKAKMNPVKRIIIILIAVAVSLLTFFVGIEIGRVHESSLPEAPDFIAMIADAIKELPGIPFDIEITQEKLNEMLNKNAEKLSPLDGAKLTISKDKTLILTGNVKKDNIEELLEGELPPYISIFLPQTVSLYIEVSFPESEENLLEIAIKNVTFAGITFDSDFTETLGINKLASRIISQIIESEQSPYYQLSGISINKSKSSDENVLIVSGTAKLS
ncbi:MAG: hypothetical protein E7481_04350 [Ruminococcaceae bacterium]|nr:hypothetical protein [Oscillospiraceae bacterium]